MPNKGLNCLRGLISFSIGILGSFYALKLVRNYRQNHRQLPSNEENHIQGHDQNLENNRLIDDNFDSKDDAIMRIPSDELPDKDQKLTMQGCAIPDATTWWQKFHNQCMKIDAEFRVLCDSQIQLLDTLKATEIQKGIEENKNKQTMALLWTETEQIQEEIKLLRLAIKSNSAACKSLQEANFVKIQQEFKELRDSFGKYITQGKFLEAERGETYSELTVNVCPSPEKACQKQIPLLRTLKSKYQDYCSDPHPRIFSWVISGIEQRMLDLLEKNKDIQCETYFDVERGLKVRPSIKLDSPSKVIFIHLEFELDEESSFLPFLHHRRFLVLDQSDVFVKHNIETVDRPGFGQNSINDTLASKYKNSILCFADELQGESRYVKDDRTLVKLILEPLSFVSKHTVSEDGILVWKIDDYWNKLKDEMNGRKQWLVSEPFRTCKTGYTVQVELFLDGAYDVEFGYSSIRVQFLLGDPGEDIKCSPRGRCWFILIDQSETRAQKHIVKSHDEAGWFEQDFVFLQPEDKVKVLEWRVPKFVPLSVMQNLRYLKNDTIMIETVLEIY